MTDGVAWTISYLWFTGAGGVVEFYACHIMHCIDDACYWCVVFMFLNTTSVLCFVHKLCHCVANARCLQNVHVWYSNIISTTAIPPKTRMHTFIAPEGRFVTCLPIPPLH